MIWYIPDEELKDKNNRVKIYDILSQVPDADIRVTGDMTLEDAVEKIKALGEDEIANLIVG